MSGYNHLIHFIEVVPKSGNTAGEFVDSLTFCLYTLNVDTSKMTVSDPVTLIADKNMICRRDNFREHYKWIDESYDVVALQNQNIAKINS